jgi:predicted porin
MKKLLLATLVSAVSIGAAHADGPTVYGKINASVDSVKNDLNTKSSINIDSNASRFGVKGSEKLTDNLNAVYQIEYGVVIDNNSSNVAAPALISGSSGGKASNGGGTTTDLNARNRFIGLQYIGLGTLKVGRFDTYLKNSRLVGGDVDVFDDAVNGNLDMTQTMAGNNRQDNAIGFESDKFDTKGFGAIQGNLMTVPSEKFVPEGADCAKVSCKTGSTGYSGSALYTNSDIGFSSAFAFDRSIVSSWAAVGTFNPANAKTAQTAVAGKNYTNIFRLVGALDLTKAGIEGLTLNALVQQSKLSDTTGLTSTPKENAFLVSAVYNFPESIAKGLSAKLQYQNSKTSGLGAGLGDVKINQIGGDVDYAFSKKTKVFGFYAIRNLKNPNNPSTAANGMDQNYAYSVVGLGMEQKF